MEASDDRVGNGESLQCIGLYPKAMQVWFSSNFPLLIDKPIGEGIDTAQGIDKLLCPQSRNIIVFARHQGIQSSWFCSNMTQWGSTQGG
eukprot:1639891-Amphidinium_carterae.1